MRRTTNKLMVVHLHVDEDIEKALLIMWPVFSEFVSGQFSFNWHQLLHRNGLCCCFHVHGECHNLIVLSCGSHFASAGSTWSRNHTYFCRWKLVGTSKVSFTRCCKRGMSLFQINISGSLVQERDERISLSITGTWNQFKTRSTTAKDWNYCRKYST